MTTLEARDILLTYYMAAKSAGETELADAIGIAGGALSYMIDKLENGGPSVLEELEEYAQKLIADHKQPTCAAETEASDLEGTESD